MTATPTPTPQPTATPKTGSNEGDGDWIYAGPDCPTTNSSNCYWSETEFIGLSAFAVDEEQTFYDEFPAILVSCFDDKPFFSFGPGGRWISLGEAKFRISIGTNNWVWSGAGTVTGDLDLYWFKLADSDEIFTLIRDSEDKEKILAIEASDLYSVVAYFDVSGFASTLQELSC